MKGLLRKIDQFLMGRTLREKGILGGGIFIAFFLVGYVAWFSPAVERMVLLNRLIPQKEKEIGAFEHLLDEYRAVLDGIQNIERRLPTEGRFSTLSFLEEIATQNKIRKNIATIRPLSPRLHESYREIPVEVKVENVTLVQIIPFLDAIEGGSLHIKRLAMKTRFSDPAFLDVTFVVSSYEKISQPGQERMPPV